MRKKDLFSARDFLCFISLLYAMCHKYEFLVFVDRIKRNSNFLEPQGIQSALHLAAMNGYDKVCNALVNLGADPNVTNKISKTPLIYAAAEGHVKVLEVLVKCPNIDLEAKGKNGMIYFTNLLVHGKISVLLISHEYFELSYLI